MKTSYSSQKSKLPDKIMTSDKIIIDDIFNKYGKFYPHDLIWINLTVKKNIVAVDYQNLIDEWMIWWI